MVGSAGEPSPDRATARRQASNRVALAVLLALAAVPLLLLGWCGMTGVLEANPSPGAFPTPEEEITMGLSRVGLALGAVGIVCLGAAVLLVRRAGRLRREAAADGSRPS